MTEPLDAPGPLTADDFETLLEASRALAGTLDLSSLLKTVMELAARVVRAESGSILLKDEATGELVFDVAMGTAGDRIKSVRLKPGEGVAGWVAANGVPVIVNDAQRDPRWTTRVDTRSDFVTRQVVAVPLTHQGRLVGVLEGINKREGAGFTSTDRHALEIFAVQAAVAIENARLFARLNSEKNTLATLVQEMSDGALLLDKTGRVTLLNAAGAALLGLVHNPAGNPVSDLFRTFEVTPALKSVLDAKEPARITFTRPSGKQLILEGSYQLLRDGSGALLIFRDVTEARREEWLKQNFLAVISHKLKTPLVAITGFAPLLLEDKSLTPAQRQGLTAMRDQGNKLSQLVERLLNFATIESQTVALARKRCRARVLVDTVRDAMVSDLARQNAVLQVDESIDSLPALSVDPARFCEVLRNLIDNGAKFNAKQKKLIRLYARAEGPEAVVSVEDDGPGIPPEDVGRIFNKFYQVEDSFTGQVEGAGLGLALAKRIVEAHGGVIQVRSVMGRGSVFTTRWPLDE